MGGFSIQGGFDQALQNPDTRNRLIRAMMGSDPGATMDPPQNDRIADDTSRHPAGFEESQPGSTDDLESRARGSVPRLAQQMRAQATAAPSRVDQLQSQYDAMQPPPSQKPISLWKKILLGAITAGGGGAGIAQGLARQRQGQQFEEERYDKNRNAILSQIEAEQRIQAQNSREDQRDVESYGRTLDQQRYQDARQDRQFAQQDAMQPPHTLDTAQGPMQWDPQKRQWAPVMVNGQPAGPKAQPKPDTPEQQFFDSPEEAGKTQAQKIADYAKVSQRPEQPQRPQQQLAVINGKVVELKPGMDVPEGTQSLSGDLKGSKPTADEQRRADLAENLNENLGTLEEIATRRPDLFGPLAGRLTGLRGAMGSNDPDIGTLETIRHQIGMAQISAHGMRSAQGVDSAATSILNSFKNGPDAVKASINAARNSVKTFQDDVRNNQRTGAGGTLKQKVQQSAPRAGAIEDGYRFKGGDPSDPNSWEKAK